MFLALLEAEGGADQWARPPLPKINEKRDAISMYLHMSFERPFILCHPSLSAN